MRRAVAAPLARPESTIEGGQGMAQQFMSKLNANERMALWGAVIVFIVSLIGTSWFTLILSAAVIVVYYLKYSPTSNITWPVQVQLINVVLAGIIGLLALLGALALIGIGGLFGGLGFGFFGGLFIIVLIGAIANLIGAGMMVLGTWREYQAMPKAAAPPPPPPPAA
jgi:sterol desaturase/sphingolipid hydroxylase (fatty acid hydroxylase superfamily)